MDLIKYVPGGVTRSVGNLSLKASKNSPKLLFVGGVVGMVGATVLACKATLKVDDVLVEHEKKLLDIKTVQHVTYSEQDREGEIYSEQDRKHDQMVLFTQTTFKIVRLYGPAVLLGSLSVAALTKSHDILSQRNAALSAAYATLETTFGNYRERVKKEVGEDREGEIWRDVQVVEVPDGKGGVTLKKIHGPDGAGYTELYSADTTHNFHVGSHEDNVMTLRQRENYLNDKLRMRGHLFLNEALSELGLDHTEAGATVGWLYKPDDPNHKGDSFVDLGCWTDQARDQINPLMMNNAEGIFLEFNVDGEIHRRLDEVKPIWKFTDKALRRRRS